MMVKVLSCKFRIDTIIMIRHELPNWINNSESPNILRICSISQVLYAMYHTKKSTLWSAFAEKHLIKILSRWCTDFCSFNLQTNSSTGDWGFYLFILLFLSLPTISFSSSVVYLEIKDAGPHLEVSNSFSFKL